MTTDLKDLPQWLSWLVTYKDLLQPLSWLIASVGGVFAASMAVLQLYQTRLWKKTELAKKILEEIWADEKCRAAMVLVDWTNRPFILGHEDEKQTVRITRKEVCRALRTNEKDLIFTRKEVFIRDCFDSLLDALQSLEHYLQTRLIDFKHVNYPLEYTVTELSGIREVLEPYMHAYHFGHAEDFLKRYEFWRLGESRGRPPCEQQDETVETSPNPTLNSGARQEQPRAG